MQWHNALCGNSRPSSKVISGKTNNKKLKAFDEFGSLPWINKIKYSQNLSIV